MDTMSKGEFASHIGVSAGRISQYIASGHIGADALIGEGRSARVNVDLAVEQIRARRDIGQSLGNGLTTRLDPEPEPSAQQASPVLGRKSVDEEIKAARLESDRRKNRLAAVDEAQRLAQLVPVPELRRQLTTLATKMDEEAAGMLADFATAIAADFHLAQRDVLHLLRRVRNEKKAGVAARAKAAAGALPETIEAVIEDAAA